MTPSPLGLYTVWTFSIPIPNTDTLIMMQIPNDPDTDTFTTKCQYSVQNENFILKNKMQPNC